MGSVGDKEELRGMSQELGGNREGDEEIMGC